MPFPMKIPSPPAVAARALLLSVTPLLAADPGSEGEGDFEIGPDCADAPETKCREVLRP